MQNFLKLLLIFSYFFIKATKIKLCFYISFAFHKNSYMWERLTRGPTSNFNASIPFFRSSDKDRDVVKPILKTCNAFRYLFLYMRRKTTPSCELMASHNTLSNIASVGSESEGLPNRQMLCHSLRLPSSVLHRDKVWTREHC